MKVLKQFIIDDLFLVIENNQGDSALVQIKINYDTRTGEEIRLEYYISDPIVLSNDEKVELQHAISDFAIQQEINKPSSILTVESSI